MKLENFCEINFIFADADASKKTNAGIGTEIERTFLFNSKMRGWGKELFFNFEIEEGKDLL